jgi:hypothetical protein
MQKIKVGVTALAASAAMLAPAGSGAASTQNSSSHTTAAASCLLACFDLYEDGLRVGHDVDLIPTIQFCYRGLPPLPVPIETSEIGTRFECYPYQGHQRWIIHTR